MWLAITREVSPAIANCELTWQERVPIDPAAAARQHAEYEKTLVQLGCLLCRLPAEPGLPDSVFVEDAAVVLDEVAVITRPGAESRRPEIDSIAGVLRSYRPLEFIRAPGTLDGGDVLRVGRRLFVGLSHRTNDAAIGQLRSIVAQFRYEVAAIPVNGCLHLKSAVTQVGPETLLINRDWIDARAFSGLRLIDVDPVEPAASNALLIASTVVYPSAFPGTLKRLESEGVAVHALDASELAKAEGGVTCCSLIFRQD
jgi:dimethylargininase